MFPQQYFQSSHFLGPTITWYMFYEKHFENLFWNFQRESLWCNSNPQSCAKLLEATVLQPFIVYTVTFLIFFENDCSLKLSLEIVIVYNGTSNFKKLQFSLKNNSALPKLIIHYLGKEVQNKPAGDKDVDIVDNDSTSYSIDGGV